MAGRWNHNIHYHPVVLQALDGERHRRVLDVGCGEGILTRELRTVAATAVGIDLDLDSLWLASQSAESGVHYVRGDILAAPFKPGSSALSPQSRHFITSMPPPGWPPWHA